MRLSMADMILQLFVIVMALWAVYAKWIAPAIESYRKKMELRELARLLNSQSRMLLSSEFLLQTKNEVSATAASNPVISTSPESQVVAAAVEEPPEPTEMGEEEEFPQDGEDVEEEEPDNDTEEEEEEEEPIEAREELALRPKRPSTRFVSSRNDLNPRTEWNAFVSTLLSTANHLIVIGASGGGKTVAMYDFTRCLIELDVPVVVCDPDAALDDWPGADVYGGGDDWTSINTVLKELSKVMIERRKARTAGTREFDPLWFVFDEYSDIQKFCQDAGTTIENGLRRARKLNIHLMIGVQDTQVKTMGFERKSSLLEHARIVKLTKRLDGSRILRLDEETTVRVPNFNICVANSPVVSQLRNTADSGATHSVSLGLVGSEVSIDTIEWGNENDPDREEEDVEVEGDGKAQVIRQLLLSKPPWPYARIVAHMGTSSARINRIKHQLRDEGLL